MLATLFHVRISRISRRYDERGGGSGDSGESLLELLTRRAFMALLRLVAGEHNAETHSRVGEHAAAAPDAVMHSPVTPAAADALWGGGGAGCVAAGSDMHFPYGHPMRHMHIRMRPQVWGAAVRALGDGRAAVD